MPPPFPGPSRARLTGFTLLASAILLVAAAFLETPPLWLVLPPWLAIGACAVAWFRSVPNHDPFKKAFFAVGAPLLLLGFGTRLPGRLLLLVLEPSLDHLLVLVTSRSFLGFSLIYAFFLVFFLVRTLRMERRLHQDEIALLREKIAHPAETAPAPSRKRSR